MSLLISFVLFPWMDEPGCYIFVLAQSTDVVPISHRLSHAQWDTTNKTWHVFVKSGHNVLADTAPLCRPSHRNTQEHALASKVRSVGRIQQMWSHSWFVFVDSDVVVTQSKQRGYQWTRQTDAGVPACCFTNWVSVGNLYSLWRYNENSNGLRFLSACSVHRLSVCTFFLNLAFSPYFISTIIDFFLCVFIHSLTLLWNSFLTLTG